MSKKNDQKSFVTILYDSKVLTIGKKILMMEMFRTYNFNLVFSTFKYVFINHYLVLKIQINQNTKYISRIDSTQKNRW